MLKNVFIIFQSHREIKHRQNQMLFAGRRLGFFQIQTFKVTAFDPPAPLANFTPVF